MTGNFVLKLNPEFSVIVINKEIGNFTCVLRTQVLDVLLSYSLIKKNDVKTAYKINYIYQSG